jgi:hypothetical protein
VWLEKPVYKLMKHMNYEARVQAIIAYNTTYLKVKISKTNARNMRLTWEQYLQVNIEH